MVRARARARPDAQEMAPHAVVVAVLIANARRPLLFLSMDHFIDLLRERPTFHPGFPVPAECLHWHALPGAGDGSNAERVTISIRTLRGNRPPPEA